MKKSVLFFASALLAAASLFVACNTDVDSGTSSSSKSSVKDKGTGSLVGVVLDNRGEPVEGALVTLGDRSTKTNKGGEFELTGIDLNDPALVGIKTTVKTADGTLTSADKTSLTAANTAYTLTVKKDGYLSTTVPGMYVSAEENIGGIEDARLASLIANYSDILKEYAKEVANGTIDASGQGNTVTSTDDEENKSATMTSVAAALKAIQDIYANLGWSYISTFAECKGLIPLNANLSGSIKLSPTPATDEVYDGTTYVPSYDAKSKKRVKVTYTGSNATNSANYSFFADLDENGNFTFEKLPSGVKLAFAVEEFTDNAGSVSALFSTSKGSAAELGTKVTYRAAATANHKIKVTTVTTATEITTTEQEIDENDAAVGNPTVTTVDNVSRPNNYAALLNNNTFDIDNFVIDENALNVDGLKVLLFAQLDKVWVVETNLVANKDDKLLKVTDPITFVFNKEIETATLKGTKALKDVEDSNYSVAVDSSDAKKVTFTPNDGVWTAGSAGNAVKLSVLAKDGTTNLLNNEFTVYLDDKIYVEISDSSKNDVELGLTQPVKLTFSKPMKTASVVAYETYKTKTLTNAFSKTWNTEKTELTLTPTTFWDKVSDADGKVVFTVEGVAADETNTVKYWKNNLEADATDATKKVGLIAYFDNKIDVTVAKVSDKAFTLTFSKAIKALTKEDIASAVTVTWATTKAGLATGTAVSDFEAKFNDANTVLTISAKNNDFANTGYYRVALTDAVVGKTGETKFRVAGTTNALTTVAFDTDFTVGPEKFAETTVEIVPELPTGAELSRAVYVSAEKYLKLTFNKDVRTSDLKVYDKSTTSYKAVRNYVFEKSVYLALNELSDDSELKVQGTVTAFDGAKKEWEAGKELDTGYALSKLTYKMVSTSLYSETVSIAAGVNDAKVEKIQPTANITFTFDQDVSTATWTAELYDSDKVGSTDKTQTSYAVTATASGKVVTVALTTESKKLEFGKTYYLSLKATKGNDVDTVVLFNTDKATAADFANLVSAPTTSLSTKILKEAVTDHNYIEINTVDYYVVPAGDKSATTKFDDFKKSINSAIVIEFTQDITGFTAVLADKDSTNYFYDWKKTTDVDAAKTYASTAVVSDDGKKITITPKYAFASQAVVVPYVFNAKGEKVELKDAADKALIDKNDTTKQFIAKDTTDDKDLSAALESTVGSSVLGFKQFCVEETGNGTKVYFQFNPIISETDTTENYGKYTLYKKAIKATTGATKWVKVGNPYTINPTAGETALSCIDTLDTAVDTDKKSNVKPAVINDFRLRNRKGAIVVEADGNEFDYSKTSTYRLVCSIDNVDIYSEPLTVEDKKVELSTTSTMNPTGFGTENEITEKDFTITAKCYLVEYRVFTTRDTTTVAVSDANNRINDTKLKDVKISDDRKTITFKLADGTKAGTNDKITITGTDASGVVGTLEIVYKN